MILHSFDKDKEDVISEFPAISPAELASFRICWKMKNEDLLVIPIWFLFIARVYNRIKSIRRRPQKLWVRPWISRRDQQLICMFVLLLILNLLWFFLLLLILAFINMP